MAQDTTYMANQFSGIPMKALIGAPLKAATDANGMMAKAQTQMILSTCFEPSEADSDHLQPKMIRFNLTRTVIGPDGKPTKTPAQMTISLPLLTLVPLNSLAVETLKVSFEMDVKSSTEYNTDASSQTDADISTNYKSHDYGIELHGSVARSSKSSGTTKDSVAARYEIELQAGQLPLPTGLTTIIDALNKSINPIPLKSQEQPQTQQQGQSEKQQEQAQPQAQQTEQNQEENT